MSPLKIKSSDGKLFIVWDDQSESIIKLANLRRYCPCAYCTSEKETQSSSYLPIYTGDQLKIKKIDVVGKYALGITWQDDHNTGIYIFDYLKKLAQANPA